MGLLIDKTKLNLTSTEKSLASKHLTSFNIGYYVVPGSSHSLFLASPSNGGCAQLVNAGVLCSCMSCT